MPRKCTLVRECAYFDPLRTEVRGAKDKRAFWSIVVGAEIVMRQLDLHKHNRQNYNIEKAAQQTKEKEENEENIYAEIDENRVRRPSIPAIEADLPKIDQALDLPENSNQENFYTNEGFSWDEDKQEGVYHDVLVYAPGMHQKGKSSEMLPGGYSSGNIDSEESPDNPYYVIEKEYVN